MSKKWKYIEKAGDAIVVDFGILEIELFDVWVIDFIQPFVPSNNQYV